MQGVEISATTEKRRISRNLPFLLKTHVNRQKTEKSWKTTKIKENFAFSTQNCHFLASTERMTAAVGPMSILDHKILLSSGWKFLCSL